MKIKGAEVKNFASYEDMVFGFEDQGLTLVSGPTGSGKSTLCDIAPWILFGKTAKDGSVDEILSWPGELITFGQIYLDNCSVSRTRGPKAKDNDLFFIPLGSIPTRGKDIPDTQRLLNEFLGMNYELYLSGAYFHEFSRTAQFFTANAKDRRLICEQIVDLSLAKKLQHRLLDEYKTANKHKDTFTSQSSQLLSSINTLKNVQKTEDEKALRWDASQETTRAFVESKYKQFEASRTKTTTNKCGSCGTVLGPNHTHTNDSPNPYLEQLADLELQTNPFAGGVKDYSNEIIEKQKMLDSYSREAELWELQLSDLDLLEQVISDYRSIAIENTIKDIETKTNEMFLNHFDSELKVTFDVAAADKLEVSILKDGNPCSFTQLSKGQRCLLKLCFGISVMQAIQNHHGIKFEQIFIDEGLSGLDDSLKVKAYGLLEGLALDYNSVFVVEHSSEMKERFLNKISVELVNGNSEISY